MMENQDRKMYPVHPRPDPGPQKGSWCRVCTHTPVHALCLPRGHAHILTNPGATQQMTFWFSGADHTVVCFSPLRLRNAQVETDTKGISGGRWLGLATLHSCPRRHRRVQRTDKG